MNKLLVAKINGEITTFEFDGDINTKNQYGEYTPQSLLGILSNVNINQNGRFIHMLKVQPFVHEIPIPLDERYDRFDDVGHSTMVEFNRIIYVGVVFEDHLVMASKPLFEVINKADQNYYLIDEPFSLVIQKASSSEIEQYRPRSSGEVVDLYDLLAPYLANSNAHLESNGFRRPTASDEQIVLRAECQFQYSGAVAGATSVESALRSFIAQ